MINKQKDIPKHWKWVTLDDIGIVVSGGTPSTKEPEFWNGDIPWITPADLSDSDEIYISKGSRNISQVGLEYSSAHLLPASSIVFSSRAPIGYVAITKNELATNQGFKNLIIPHELVNPKYVYYYLKTVKELAENMASGTTFLELSTTKFRQIPIPLALIEVQNRIVGKIEELFSEIEYAKNQLNDALIKLEYQFLKTLSEYFSKYDGTKYKLYQVAEWGSGGTPSRKNSSYFNGTIPWIKTQELKSKYITEAQEYLTKDGLENSSAKIYPVDSIVIAMYGATVGRLSILKIDACTNQACAVGVINNPEILDIEYLYYFLLVNKQNLILQAKGGAQQNISLSVIKDFIINIPTIEQQKRLVNDINLLNTEILNQKNILEKELLRTDALTQKIYQDAFNGTLVSDEFGVNKDKLLQIYIKRIKEENDKYLSNHIEKSKMEKKVKMEKKNLLNILTSNFKNNAFYFDDIINISSMSINSLEDEFISLLRNGRISKIYDEESKSIKFKIS